MLTTISHAELALLNYLHAHSGGSGERISLDPKPIARSLRISVTQLAADSASPASETSGPTPGTCPPQVAQPSGSQEKARIT